MSLDIEFINSLKELELKESKNRLAKYAEQFNINLKKSKSFDSMVNDLKDQLEELESEPLPENNTGLSTRDLFKIAPDKQLDNNDILLSTKEQSVPEVIPAQPDEQLLIDSPVIEQPVKILEQPEQFKLPENYSPHLIMLGRGDHAHVTLPWWIYQWITENPDWKTNPEKFPHHYGIDTLYGLIYFINRDGSVKIRETKNSDYFILE